MTGCQSKAAWLAAVRNTRLGRHVPYFDVIAATDWLERPGDCLVRIHQRFPGAQLAVRSSKHNETAGLPGQAGLYRSFGPVDPDNRAALRRAIKSVFASYGDLHETDEVMLKTSPSTQACCERLAGTRQRLRRSVDSLWAS
jgi:hypothetical protein